MAWSVGCRVFCGVASVAGGGEVSMVWFDRWIWWAAAGGGRLGCGARRVEFYRRVARNGERGGGSLAAVLAGEWWVDIES